MMILYHGKQNAYGIRIVSYSALTYTSRVSSGKNKINKFERGFLNRNGVGRYAASASFPAWNDETSGSTQVAVTRTILSVEDGGGGASDPFLLLALLGAILMSVPRARDRHTA